MTKHNWKCNLCHKFVNPGIVLCFNCVMTKEGRDWLKKYFEPRVDKQ